MERVFHLRPEPVSDFLTQIFVPITLASSGLLVLLTTALCAERVARNRRERLARERRQSYGDILAEHNLRAVDELASRAACSYPARCDLVDALVLTRWSTGSVFAGHAALRDSAERDALHRDSARRGVGTALLGVIGGPEATAVLTRLMREDPDIELRLVAARALRVLGDDDAAWDLLRGLRDGVLPTARIVEQLGRPFAARAQVEALEIGEFRHVWADIAEALGLAGYLPAAQAIARLAADGDERERIKACRALGRLADPLVVPLLIRALDDEAWAVRAQAATALGACGHASAVAPLANALADHNWWVRANSASSLRLCGLAGLDALRHAVATHPDRYARDRALEALALESARALPVAA
jgi:HEAT repeat protein